MNLDNVIQLVQNGGITNVRSLRWYVILALGYNVKYPRLRSYDNTNTDLWTEKKRVPPLGQLTDVFNAQDYAITLNETVKIALQYPNELGLSDNDISVYNNISGNIDISSNVDPYSIKDALEVFGKSLINPSDNVVASVINKLNENRYLIIGLGILIVINKLV